MEELIYVVAWDSGRGIRYADNLESGCELPQNGIQFETELEALEYINNHCGDHVWIEEW